jgi:hypothetical protein
MSKKRTTHGPIIRKETVASSSTSSPEKNRFRIYFASPVEDADGPSLKALHAMETVDEDNAGEEQHDEDEEEADDNDDEEQEQEAEEEDEEHGGEGDEEGQEEYYEAEGQDGGEAQGEEQDRDQADEQQKAEEVEAKDDSAAENQVEGDMSGVVEEDDEDEENKPADESGVEPGEIAETPLDAEETKEQDVTMRDPSVPPQIESESTAEVKDDTPAEKAVESTESVSAAPADTPVSAPVEADSSKPTEPAADTPAESSSRVPSPTKKDRQKQPVVAPLAPREPSSHRIADARFRRSPSLPATSSDTPRPESNRLSILYANGKRRICLDSAIVESVKIHRKKGSIQVTLDAGAVKRKWEQDKQVEQIVKRIKETEVADDEVGEREKKEKDDGKIEVDGKSKGDEKKEKDAVTKEDIKPEEWSLTKGILVSPASNLAVAYHFGRHGSALLFSLQVEALDEEHNVFGPVNAETLANIWASMDVSAEEEESPPLHRLLEELQSGTLGTSKDGGADATDDQTENEAGPDGETSDHGSLKLELTAYLDMDRPLTEPKWVKSGHVEDWVKGGHPHHHHHPAAKAGRGSDEPDDASWRMKLKVVDPDMVSSTADAQHS